MEASRVVILWMAEEAQMAKEVCETEQELKDPFQGKSAGRLVQVYPPPSFLA